MIKVYSSQPQQLLLPRVSRSVSSLIPYKPLFFRPQCAFTLLEVMIATMILAIGITAAMSAIFNNNNFRRSLDESSMADLVLRQMSSRLKTTNLGTLGTVYMSPSGTPQSWTLHLRATASTNIPVAATTNAALSSPYTGPFQPLTQQDLIDAGIMREPVPIDNMSVYVEYYNLSTITGLQNVAGSLIRSITD